MEKSAYTLLKKKIDKLMEEALKNHVFTACSVGFFMKKEKAIKRKFFNYGLVEDGQGAFPVDEQTFFDLASLTKPLVTSLCLANLIQEGKINIEDEVQKFFKTSWPDENIVTLLHLLNHSSGLPAHRPYYKKLVKLPHADRIDKLIDWILAENLLFKPGDNNLYSDLGFIILGRIIEMVSGEPLDEYWKRRIIAPLNLNNGLLFASKLKKGSGLWVTTGTCPWSKIRLCGTVHDDNCRSLGGVAGHAGLFGTAEAVLSLCENILLQFKGDLQHPSYRTDNLIRFLGNKQGPWRFGFDTPTGGLSSSGKYFSNLTVGHLGFTGTSFWIDLQRGIAIVFLTNRVFCGEELTPIKMLRPQLHDTIMEFLLKKSG